MIMILNDALAPRLSSVRTARSWRFVQDDSGEDGVPRALSALGQLDKHQNADEPVDKLLRLSLDQVVAISVLLFPLTRVSNFPTTYRICRAWAFNSSAADADSSALAAFCWIVLSIS